MLPLLSGVRVVDFSQLFTGATSKLADLGADVIKVEQAPYGDYMRDLPPAVDAAAGVGLPYLMFNRNKRSICLDLKSEAGMQVVWRLIEGADVLVETSRPGAWARFGLDYESVCRVKPEIVYCSMSGYGQDGPYRNLPSHGLNIDAAAGMLRIERAPDGRPEIARRSGMGAELGAMHAALAVVSALIQRHRTGRGEYLDVSCWDGAMAYDLGYAVALNCPPGVEFTDVLDEGGFGPRYDVYGTKDDKVLLLAPIERKFWVRFCEVIGKPEWTDRGRWDTAMDFGNDDPTLRDDIQSVMVTRTAEDWITAFNAANVPASPVLERQDLLDDPHVQARGIVVSASEDPMVKYVRIPIRIPGAAFTIVHTPPRKGEHTVEVLSELGYGDSEQENLLATGAAHAATRGETR